MCSHLLSVCLVCQVLNKNTYFREHVLVVVSKYSICDTENKTKEIKPSSMFKHASIEKTLWSQWNIPAWFIATLEKGMVL